MTSIDTQRRSSRILTVIAASVAALALATGTTLPAAADTPTAADTKGSSVTKVKWSPSNLDVTLAGASAKLSARVKDSTPISAVQARIEHVKTGMTRYVSLYLVDGSNRNGTWSAERWFGLDDKGSWRVTEVATSNQDGYVYALRKAKGIGKNLKVTAGPKTRIKMTKPKQGAYAGTKAKISAKLTRGGKSYSRQRVVFTLEYLTSNGWKYKTMRATTNAKGVATITPKMPTTDKVKVYANFHGKKKVAQPSTKSTTVKRKFDKAKVNLSVTSKATVGKKVTARATFKLKKKAMKKTKVIFEVTNRATGAVSNIAARTNKKGVAKASFTVPSADVVVRAKVQSKKVKGASKSKRVQARTTLQVKLNRTTAPSYYGEVEATVTAGSTLNGGVIRLYYERTNWDGSKWTDYTTHWPSGTRTATLWTYAENESYSSVTSRVWAEWHSYDFKAGYLQRAKSSVQTITVPA